ncbi:MAG: 1-acyl-sn-glycerol-3-phosphate acyltransferase [Anaerolineales bacterium]|nr:1-acyl-sn-glycerol-3-phosphate acyltransferase [Anaerolineales bacterium]
MKNPFHTATCWLVRTGTNVICRIDGQSLANVPSRGPLIVVSNHIGSIEVPLIYAHLQPRRMIGLAKVETWDNPFMGWLFDLWEAIPVRRGEADLDAVRRCLEVLAVGDILAVAPEGTRSRDGRLLRAQAGVVTLALRSEAPILPIAHWGAERFGTNLRRLARTDFHVRVGRPFSLRTNGVQVTREVRQQMVDEVMGQVAALMPEAYRGEYAGWALQPPRYLEFQ